MVEIMCARSIGGFGIVIPARYGAVRLPGKPLRLICGKPLIVHVYENALRANANFTIVATDDARIADTVRAAGGDVELTSSAHRSGTDRLAEVVEKRRIDGDMIIVNVQGDEPLLPPEHIAIVAESLLQDSGAGISTLAVPIRHTSDISNPNVVKVVLNREGRAMYFSRAPIPWLRDTYPLPADADIPSSHSSSILQHVGIYGYRAATLARLAALPACDYETAESLEQLRALFWGIAIHVSVVADSSGHGVDTEDDLERIESYLVNRNR